MAYYNKYIIVYKYSNFKQKCQNSPKTSRKRYPFLAFSIYLFCNHFLFLIILTQHSLGNNNINIFNAITYKNTIPIIEIVFIINVLIYPFYILKMQSQSYLICFFGIAPGILNLLQFLFQL